MWSPPWANNRLGRARAVTQSAPFRRWFGKSVLMTPEGDPMVLYHWTPWVFTKFKAGGINPRLSGKAIWLTPHRQMAAAAHNLMHLRYKRGEPIPETREQLSIPTGVGDETAEVWEGVNVIPLYARIERPLEIVEGDYDALEALRASGLPASPVYLTPDNIQRMKSMGFDGIVSYRSNGELNEIVVLSPTQVKSAIGNRGTFSRSDSDILHGL